MARTLALLLALLASAAYPQQMHEHHPGQSAAAERFEPEFARFAREMDAGMEQMMHGMHAPGYSGNADVDFLAMMIPHHEGAVEMARLVLVHGRDPLTRKLAEDIIASQMVEIEGMKRRLDILRAGAEPRPGDFPALGGTRGPAK